MTRTDVVPRTGKSSDIFRAYGDSNSASRAVVSKGEPIFVWAWKAYRKLADAAGNLTAAEQ